MKKNLFILATTAAMLGSCSNDVTTAVNTTLNAPQEITFRTTTDGMTRAVNTDLTYLQTNGIYVSARNSSGDTEYSNFTNIHFTYNTSVWSSSPAYLWPSSGDLDFYAYAPVASGQITAHDDYKSFAVTPSSTAAEQIDLVFANANGKNKTNSGTGVALNFRHAESMVAINLKNSNAGMTMTVGNVTIGNVKNSGTYSYTKIDAGTTGTGSLPLNGWTYTGATNTTYTQTVTDGSAYSSATAAQAGVDMILIPQAMTAVSTYASGDAEAAFDGPYITVQLKIQQGGAYIVGTEGAFVTAMWPLPTLTWDPGHKYTYIIDLAGGGYYPTNHTGDSVLDPIIAGNNEIKFASVTVDTWDTTSPAGDQTVSM
ncbi:MAG: fimbrillin family protein [Prevotella sp.]|nr:fimbrillin family protein [Prevotella sp.]